MPLAVLAVTESAIRPLTTTRGGTVNDQLPSTLDAVTVPISDVPCFTVTVAPCSAVPRRTMAVLAFRMRSVLEPPVSLEAARDTSGAVTVVSAV